MFIIRFTWAYDILRAIWILLWQCRYASTSTVIKDIWRPPTWRIVLNESEEHRSLGRLAWKTHGVFLQCVCRADLFNDGNHLMILMAFYDTFQMPSSDAGLVMANHHEMVDFQALLAARLVNQAGKGSGLKDISNCRSSCLVAGKSFNLAGIW